MGMSPNRRDEDVGENQRTAWPRGQLLGGRPGSADNAVTPPINGIAIDDDEQRSQPAPAAPGTPYSQLHTDHWVSEQQQRLAGDDLRSPNGSNGSVMGRSDASNADDTASIRTVDTVLTRETSERNDAERQARKLNELILRPIKKDLNSRTRGPIDRTPSDEPDPRQSRLDADIEEMALANVFPDSIAYLTRLEDRRAARRWQNESAVAYEARQREIRKRKRPLKVGEWVTKPIAERIWEYVKWLHGQQLRMGKWPLTEGPWIDQYRERIYGLAWYVLFSFVVKFEV